MTWPALPCRNLDPAELRAFVDELARQPERWREQVSFAGQERHFVSLYRDDHIDLWLICWTRANDTGWHDHDISSGAVHIVRGSLRECSPRIGGDHVERVFTAGTSFSFGPEHIHRLVGKEERSISIHAYSPPLWRLGQYSIGPDGVMRRVSVSYADELRPLENDIAA
jgi:hypothetical protein